MVPLRQNPVLALVFAPAWGLAAGAGWSGGERGMAAMVLLLALVSAGALFCGILDCQRRRFCVGVAIMLAAVAGMTLDSPAARGATAAAGFVIVVLSSMSRAFLRARFITQIDSNENHSCTTPRNVLWREGRHCPGRL